MTFEEEWRLGVRVKFQRMYETGNYAQVPLDNYDRIINSFLNNNNNFEQENESKVGKEDLNENAQIESRPLTPRSGTPRVDYHEELATELIYYVRERIRRRRVPIKRMVNMRVMTVVMWGWGRPFLLRTMVMKWRSPPLRIHNNGNINNNNNWNNSPIIQQQ